MAKIETQFSHIFIHYYSNKSNSTCKLFISEPSKSQEDKMGRLFGIFEINTPSKENGPIITEIINHLEQTYYGYLENQDIPLGKAFEKSLAEANQRFNQIIENKQVYLVGNLNQHTIKEKINLTVGLIKGKKLYLSFLNNIGTFLIHKGKQTYKVIDIRKISTESQDENQQTTETNDQQQQAKLFSNLIQGEINAPDYLVLANQNFFNYISLERIQKTITSLPVNKSAEYFKNSLLQHEGNNFAAIIINNSIVDETNGSVSPSTNSISELNYTESSTEKLLTPSIWSNLKNIAQVSVGYFKKIRSTKEIETSDEQEQNIDTAANQGELDEQQYEQANKSSNINKVLGFIKGKTKKIVNKTKDKAGNLASQTPSFAEQLHKLKKYLKLKIAYIGHNLKKIPHLSKILLVVAILLIFLFVYSISYFKQEQTDAQNSEEFNNQVN